MHVINVSAFSMHYINYMLYFVDYSIHVYGSEKQHVYDIIFCFFYKVLYTFNKWCI